MQNERMTKIEHFYKAFIAAARTVSIPVAFLGFMGLSQAGHGVNWRLVFKWETVWIIAFFGYAFFILLPIDRLSSVIFWLLVLVGTILAAGSTWTTRLYYLALTEGLFEGQLIFRIILWFLLLPVYLYIPILILKRKYESDKRKRQPTKE